METNLSEMAVLQGFRKENVTLFDLNLLPKLLIILSKRGGTDEEKEEINERSGGFLTTEYNHAWNEYSLYLFVSFDEVIGLANTMFRRTK